MLVGKKAILRPVQSDDIKKFHQWRNDREIKKMSLMHPFPVTLESEEDWYVNISKTKDNRFVFFSIDDKKSNEVVGFTKLFNISWIHRFCYFGIVIGEKSVHGKGIGTEATKLVIDYAFNTLNLKKIILEVGDFNANAIKLYEKLGFVVEGRLKENVIFDGKCYDVLVMSLFKQNLIKTK